MATLNKKVPTAAELNELYAQFWLRQAAITERRASDPAVLHFALQDMQFDADRGIAFKALSFDESLAKGEMAAPIIRREFARKGGRAPRNDALDRLIEQLLLEKPELTAEQLLRELRGPAGAGTVTSADAGCVEYVNDDGKPNTAPISALKDRLYRIKKKSKKQ